MATTQVADAPTKTQTDVLISADSHIIEEPDFLTTALPAEFRERAPVWPPRGVGGHFQAHPGGFDPKARIGEMAQDGVSAEVLYPSLTMDLYGMTDVALQAACFRAYNDWIIEYCSAAPDRLFGIPMISTYNIDHAIEELERCRKAGLIGALVWQAPPEELAFSTDHYERFWAAAQELDAPINLHILTGAPYQIRQTGPPGEPAPRRQAYQAARGAVNQKLLHASNAVSDLILTGVLERYPRLKFVLVENEASWIPFYLAQYDKYWSRGTMQSPIKMLPSEYFQRQFYATFFNDPPSAWLFPHWGQDNCMWSNDYPHPNSTWPNSRDVIARDLGHLPPEVREKLIRGNVTRLYNLPDIPPLA